MELSISQVSVSWRRRGNRFAPQMLLRPPSACEVRVSTLSEMISQRESSQRNGSRTLRGASWETATSGAEFSFRTSLDELQSATGSDRSDPRQRVGPARVFPDVEHEDTVAVARSPLAHAAAAGPSRLQYPCRGRPHVGSRRGNGRSRANLNNLARMRSATRRTTRRFSGEHAADKTLMRAWNYAREDPDHN